MIDFLTKNFLKDRFPWISIVIILICLVFLLLLKNDSYKDKLTYARQREINRIPEIGKAPNSPAYIEGVINLRGRIISVINLRKKFGMPEKDTNEKSRIIVMDLQGSTMGILVDSVSEVLRIPSVKVEPAPQMASNINKEFIKGIAKLDERLIILIDMDMMMEKS